VPLLLNHYEVYSAGADTSTLTTPTFEAGNGEVIVVKATTWDTGTPMGTPTGGGQTYQPAQLSAPGGFKGWAGTWVCTVAGSPAPFAISSTPVGSASRHTLDVERWGFAFLDATPAVFTTNTGAGGDLNSSITTTAPGSIVSFCAVDLNSRDPAGRTWTPTLTVEDGLFDGHAGSNSVQYFGWAPFAAAGANTLNLNVPAGGLAWTLAGVEIKASVAVGMPLMTAQKPAGDFFDNAPITLATTVIYDTAGQVSGAGFYSRSTNPGGTYQIVMWLPTHEDDGSGAGTVLATANVSSVVNGAWNYAFFSSPVTITPGQPYKVGLRTSLGAYSATNGFFSSADLVYGHSKGPQTNAFQPGYGTFYNGSFVADITSYPNQTFNGTSYFVNPIFEPASGLTLAAAFTATAGMSETLSNETRLAAGLTATGSMTDALTREVQAAAGLTATGSMTVGLSTPSEVTLSASLTATAGMSAAMTIPTVGPVDPIATPVANALLACLTAQMNELVSPPAKIELRAGAEGGPLIGPNVDECCAGLAWVRVASVYPSWDSFPSPDNTWLPCGPLAYAVVLEMGSAFCMPWSDSSQEWDNVDPPSTTDWANAHTTLMQHQTLMRRAAACCFPHTQRRAVGEWNPLSVEGGCMGGTLRVTVSVMAPCGDC
jgi:hypothetical protein